ncbi:M16 family metallopeptidase [Aestuariimicrobium ganziense]|uniref:M16 family metallopeptidase n=1 Tax=Aestuariimicrobium ganziense TaxID=2773677 RepID=UPI0019433C37|nr:pitrilysin family protein [Aestuariimicrobium ganziense]
MTRVAYDLEHRVLDNGLHVVVSPDQLAPGVAVNLWYRVGSRDEIAGRTGFAHLFEHLMFQGTWTGVTPGEHLAAMQAAGGEANATTSFDRTNYHETVHRGALELALWLESQRMGHLRVDQINFDTQRDVVKEEKRQRYDNVPYGDTFELLTAQHFGDHAYGHVPIGSMADLDAASLDDVQAFHQRFYRPSNASLVVCGKIGVDEGFALVEQHFAHLPALDRPDRRPPASLGPHDVAHEVEVVRPVPRDMLHLGWRVPVFHHPDTLALDLGLGVLTRTQSSRLHQLLVVQRELAEGVSAHTMGLETGTNLALVSARARQDGPSDELERVLREALAEFAATGPTEAELDRAHAQLEREWLSELATVDSRADAINHFSVALGDPQRLNTHLDELLAITPERIAQALSQWLDPEHCSVLRYRREEA